MVLDLTHLRKDDVNAGQVNFPPAASYVIAQTGQDPLVSVEEEQPPQRRCLQMGGRL
eukprot:CAMPEP_0182506940 /NCGR_PEP_ID=MMETSP1321-20130603/22204_1 /TAXON_ID=91990 /ORGANISM="Bolidomonas sp., Strain RCC1657" /LENGTH=56 /DNA_ID=CAMNT_0024712747 /DNA_START=124 /DNA_END=290 /DNA_ORIENTATION=+